jgi:chromosome condensin MukBEF complex kleisin-like MukF subunit
MKASKQQLVITKNTVNGMNLDTAEITVENLQETVEKIYQYNIQLGIGYNREVYTNCVDHLYIQQQPIPMM